MHRRKYRVDLKATTAARFLSRYSYVSSRIHPNSDPPHQCRYLAGEDVGVARRECFERDRYRCTAKNCGRCVSWETGEMDHGGKTKLQRCDCPENHSTKCWRCHRKKHNREVKWTKYEKALPSFCPKHPRAVYHDSDECPACEAVEEFLRLTDLPTKG